MYSVSHPEMPPIEFTFLFEYNQENSYVCFQRVAEVVAWLMSYLAR